MQNYLLSISMIKNSLKEGKVIEAYERLQQLEKINLEHIEEYEKKQKKRRGNK